MAVDILHDHAKPIYGKAHLNSRFRNVAFETVRMFKTKARNNVERAQNFSLEQENI